MAGLRLRAGTAEGLRHQHSAEHGQRPAGGDHHPAGIRRVRLAQRHAGVDAVAQQHQNQRAHKLAKPDRMHRGFLVGCTGYDCAGATSRARAESDLLNPSILTCRAMAVNTRNVNTVKRDAGIGGGVHICPLRSRRRKEYRNARREIGDADLVKRRRRHPIKWR